MTCMFCKKKMQITLNKISAWAKKWGFKISQPKTIGIVFGNKRQPHPVKLRLNNKPIQFQKQVKFLGLIFDSKLTWRQHINYIQERSKSVLNLMRYVQANNYGTNTDTLLTLYRSLLRSILDYGCQAFNSATPAVKKVLDRIQYQGLRIALGALKSTPVHNLLVEAGEKPLQLRRDELSLKYWARCKQNPKNPTNELTEDCKEYRVKSHKWKNDTVPYGYRVRKLLQENNLDKTKIVTHDPPTFPPWVIKTANASCKLKNIIDKKDNPHIIKNLTQEYLDKNYKNHLKIYTDGSKDPVSGKTGAAFIIPREKVSYFKRTSDNLSVYTTEMIAIFKALKHVQEQKYNHKQIVILTDSLSAIKSIQSDQSSRPDILEPIQILAYKLKAVGIDLTIEWIPAHVGILGNETTDKLAKAALNHRNIEIKIALSSGEFNAIIKTFYKNKWQSNWDNNQNTWFHDLKPKIDSKTIFHTENRFHAKTITRLRLGTTLLAGHCGQYIRKIPPDCDTCNIKEDIPHVLLYCNKHDTARQNLISKLQNIGINAIDIKTLLAPTKEQQNFIHKAVIDYISEIDYHKII